jgi:hypothetical protein
MPNPGEGQQYLEKPLTYEARVWDGEQETVDWLESRGYLSDGTMNWDPESRALTAFGALEIQNGFWIADRRGWVDIMPTDEAFAQKYTVADEPATGGGTSNV